MNILQCLNIQDRYLLSPSQDLLCLIILEWRITSLPLVSAFGPTLLISTIYNQYIYLHNTENFHYIKPKFQFDWNEFKKEMERGTGGMWLIYDPK